MRRDLERRLFDLQQSNELADRGSEKRLRKELKKLKILYKDAKYALDSQVINILESASRVCDSGPALDQGIELKSSEMLI